MLSIKQIQGEELLSPLTNQVVTTQGIVTGTVKKGFFLQTPNVEWDKKSSDAIFVYSPAWTAPISSKLEIIGAVVDYVRKQGQKPVTQIQLKKVRILQRVTKSCIHPIELTADSLSKKNEALACYLNSLEGMLIKLPAKQTFIAPSNVHGDYVLDGHLQVGQTYPPTFDKPWLRDKHNGILMHHRQPLKWYPGFRISQYHLAPQLNVGSTLLSDIIGPLNYRANSYQLVVQKEFKFDPHYVSLDQSSIKSSEGAITIMTLNCFNLDPNIESSEHVLNARQDIDDDWGEGRFHTLAQAIVLQANCPDIIALQEIQDNDGAEISQEVDAQETLNLLVKTIEQLADIRYEIVNKNPKLNQDGGQPGGNIRNAFLYNPNRLELDSFSVVRLFEDEASFVDSRKPLAAKFTETTSGKSLFCINVHLASKRHQASLFDEQAAGVDSKLTTRIQQASLINKYFRTHVENGENVYITGDFNDTEESETMKVFNHGYAENLIFTLPENARYDYNHRGQLQALMHGIVSKDLAPNTKYEIIHGNELIGVKPGQESNKPSDHAYVLAKMNLLD